MKPNWKKLLVILAGVVVIAAVVYASIQSRKESVPNEQGTQPGASVPTVDSSTNGETVVRFDQAAQKRVGLKTEKMVASTLSREVKAFGQVLDPTPLAGLLSEMDSARASLAATSKELDRVKALFAQGQNASAKSVDAAEAAVKHDEIALKANQAQLLSMWGKAIADRPDLPAFVQSLLTRETVLVRLDAPSGELTEMPVGGRVLSPGAIQPIGAQFLGRATTADRQVQGDGFLLVATNGPASLAPGISVTGFLQLPGDPLRGVIVPNAAVIRWSERSWVSVQSGDSSFVRREIALSHPVDGGWFVTDGVNPGEQVVVVGAQMLLSQERKKEFKAD